MPLKSDSIDLFQCWKLAVVFLMWSEYSQIFGEMRIGNIDWSAWEEYYDDGLSPRDAILGEISCMEE